MSKTPEQVARDSVTPVLCGFADAVVSALRSAGWLREDGSVPLEHHRAEVATLTRERDEALAEMRAYSETCSALGDVIVDLKRSAASPEVLRVVDASLAEWRRLVRDWPREVHDWPEWREWWDANAALSASRQPKAQEPPRYFTVNNEVYERTPTGSLCVTAHYGPDPVARAEAECERLNAAEAK